MTNSIRSYSEASSQRRDGPPDHFPACVHSSRKNIHASSDQIFNKGSCICDAECKPEQASLESCYRDVVVGPRRHYTVNMASLDLISQNRLYTYMTLACNRVASKTDL